MTDTYTTQFFLHTFFDNFPNNFENIEKNPPLWYNKYKQFDKFQYVEQIKKI